MWKSAVKTLSVGLVILCLLSLMSSQKYINYRGLMLQLADVIAPQVANGILIFLRIPSKRNQNTDTKLGCRFVLRKVMKLTERRRVVKQGIRSNLRSFHKLLQQRR